MLAKKLNYIVNLLFIHTYAIMDHNSYFNLYFFFGVCIIFPRVCIPFLLVCVLLNKWGSTFSKACIYCRFYLLSFYALNKWGGGRSIIQDYL